MNLNPEKFQRIIEAAIMVAGRPMTVAHIQKLFDENDQPTTAEVREALKAIAESYADRGIELHEVASGFQFQAKTDLKDWLCRLWEERPPRYSRAILETLALIAYRQPITRAEVEEVRGVAVSTQITKTLLEREWVKVVGYRDVPGKPALYGTTQAFLDHFNLKSLAQLPTLAELRDLETQEAKLQQVQFELANQAEMEAANANSAAAMTEDTAEEEATETEITEALEIAEVIEIAEATEMVEAVESAEAALETMTAEEAVAGLNAIEEDNLETLLVDLSATFSEEEANPEANTTNE